jgi:uncharacterized protein involved in exopolysaccharide biosynthesis
MTYMADGDRNWIALSAGSNPWPAPLIYLFKQLRRSLWVIVAMGVVGGALGLGAKLLWPSKYTATEQLLFDPQGLRIFPGDLTTGRFDANVAINFVESQMSVILSERVLSRVIDRECSRRKLEPSEEAFVVGKEPISDDTHPCEALGLNVDQAKAFAVLRRNVVVKRPERSFVVDVSASARTPELAAHLASSVVAAYLAEDARARAEAANRLNSELSGRLETLRKAVEEADAKAEAYRSDRNLVRIGDRLIVEQKLNDATASFNAAVARTDRVAARAKQIEAAPHTASALGALGADADTRTLAGLMDRRATLLVELAPLAARLGARHPLLVDARNRVAEVDRSISSEFNGIVSAARADLLRARTEQDGLERTVNELGAKVARARQAEIELHALEQEAEANRKLLASFETRSREAREFGRIDNGNLRVVSNAREPETRQILPGLALWAALGLVVGSILACGFVTLAALFRYGVASLTAHEAPEGDRVATEAVRAAAEGDRAAVEAVRAAVEGIRAAAEGMRAAVKRDRVSAGGTRAATKRDRAAAKRDRASTEEDRASAEEGRASTEEVHASAEDERASTQEDRAAGDAQPAVAFARINWPQ